MQVLSNNYPKLHLRIWSP